MLTATPLQSSMLKSTSYDSETKTLVITFNPSKKQIEQGLPGDTFYYSNVPFHAFEGILASESAGKYFLSEIKGVYEGRKVSAEDRLRQAELIPNESPKHGWVTANECSEFGECQEYKATSGQCGDICKDGCVRGYPSPAQYPYPTQLPDLNSKRPWE